MFKLNYEKTYFYIISLFAFALPLSRAAISLLGVILLLIWIVEKDYKRKFIQIKENKVFLVLLCLIFYTIMSIFWTENLTLGFDKVAKEFYFLLIIVIATSLKKEYIQRVITFFLLGMFVSEVIAYGIFFELWEFNGITPENPSPFMQHIHYSTFMAFTSMILLSRLLSKRYTIKEKLFIGFFFFTVTGNLFLATGRTGQVALIFGIITLSIIHFKLSIRTILVSMVLSFSIFILGYNLSSNFQNRVNTTKSEILNISNMDLSSSWGVRIFFWITTYDFIKENPFGSGIGDYKLAIKEQVEKNDYSKFNISSHYIEFAKRSHPHNQYLLILLQTGIPGLMIFLYFLYNILSLKIYDPELKEFSILFVVIVSFAFLAEPLLILHNPTALFILFIGLFTNINVNSKN